MSTRRRSVPFLLTIAVTIIIFGVSMSRTQVKEIGCQVGEAACPGDVQAALNVLQGKSMVWHDLSAEAQTAILPFTGLRYHSLSKSYPSKVVVELEPQSLEYQAKFFQQDTYLAINDQAKVVPLVAKQEIFTLVIPDSIWQTWTSSGKVESNIHDQLKNVPQLLAKLSLQPQQVVLLDEQNVVLYLPNNVTAVVEVLRLEPQLSRLGAVLNGIKNQNFEQPVQEIDLRFNQPVLRFTRNIPRHESL